MTVPTHQAFAHVTSAILKISLYKVRTVAYKGKGANIKSVSTPISPFPFVSPDFLRHTEYLEKFLCVAL